MEIKIESEIEGKSVLDEKEIRAINCSVLRKFFQGIKTGEFLFYGAKNTREIKNFTTFVFGGTDLYVFFDCEGINYSSRIDLTEPFCLISKGE